MKRLFLGLITFATVACIFWWVFQEQRIDVIIHTRELDVDGNPRIYRIVLPEQRPSAVPILFAFHGIGDTPDSMAAASELDQLAADYGFILVYPAGRNAMWATINIDSDNLDANPDVQFFDAVLNYMKEKHDIDPNRVYLAGMSNGASFVHVLASARGEQIAAAVAHSGSRPKTLDPCDESLPMMLLAGAEDPIAPLMKSNAELYRRSGCPIKLFIIPGLAHE